MTPNFIDLMGDKNHLGYDMQISMHELLQSDVVLSARFQERVKEDMVHGMLPLFTEKVEFTEEYRAEWDAKSIRANVYVFSPEEIKCLAQTVNAEFKARNAAIAELERMNDEQVKCIDTIGHSRHLLELQLGACIQAQAILIPPPIIMTVGQSYEAGYQAGKKKVKAEAETARFLADNHLKQLNDANRRITELEAPSFDQARLSAKTDIIIEQGKRIKELEEQTTNQVSTILLNDKRIKELEGALSSEQRRVNAKTDTIIKGERRIEELEDQLGAPVHPDECIRKSVVDGAYFRGVADGKKGMSDEGIRKAVVEGALYMGWLEDNKKDKKAADTLCQGYRDRIEYLVQSKVEQAKRVETLDNLASTLSARIEELEYSMKGIQQETKEVLDPFKPKPEPDYLF